MNKAIAQILLSALGEMTLFEKRAGLVQVAEYEETTYGEDGETPKTIIKRIPVSCDSTADVRTYNELTPDSSKRGLLYFEDGGTSSLGAEKGFINYRSRLRLVAWFNMTAIDNSVCTNIGALMMNHIIARLLKVRNVNTNGFVKMSVSLDSIPKQDKSIFSAYTYDLYNTQFLLSPYEYFAIDFSVSYLMHEDCLTEITII